MELSEEAKRVRREYQREYHRKHPEKQKEYTRRYLERKAKETEKECDNLESEDFSIHSLCNNMRDYIDKINEYRGYIDAYTMQLRNHMITLENLLKEETEDEKN